MISHEPPDLNILLDTGSGLQKLNKIFWILILMSLKANFKYLMKFVKDYTKGVILAKQELILIITLILKIEW